MGTCAYGHGWCPPTVLPVLRVPPGGASLASGSMEVMVHRRTQADDTRGVGEPLNETACGCTACNCAGRPLSPPSALESLTWAWEGHSLAAAQSPCPARAAVRVQASAIAAASSGCAAWLSSPRGAPTHVRCRSSGAWHALAATGTGRRGRPQAAHTPAAGKRPARRRLWPDPHRCR